MTNVSAATIDGITRPCRNCDTTNIHYEGDRQCPKGYEPAEIESTTPAFDAVLGMARYLNQPELYTSDLFRDYQILTGRSKFASTIPDEFLWAIETCGTHIVVLDGPLATWGLRDQYGPQMLTKTIVQNFGRAEWFHWTGCELVPLTVQEALRVAEDAERPMARAA